MTLDLFTRNLLALILQATALGAFGAVLPALFQLRAPRPLLLYWQGLLAVILVLPSLQFGHSGAGPGTGNAPLLRFTSVAITNPSGWHAGRVLAILIGAVALIRLMWLAAGIWALRRHWNEAEPIPYDSPVLIGVSPSLRGPMSFGIWRPVILLPESWRSMTPDLQRAIVCHESIHIERHDWILHMIEEAIRAVLWFQPAVWLATAQIRMAREQVVDLEVVHRTQARDAYISALLSAATDGSSFGLPAPCFVRKHQLVERVRKIMKEYRMSKRRIALSFSGFALVLAAAGTFAVQSFPVQAAQAEGSATVYHVKDLTTAPKVLFKTDPEYASAARDQGVEGTVVLQIEITPEGVPQHIEVAQGLGYGLNEKAVESVGKWRFAPGLKDGVPVTVAATIEVHFRLK